MQKSDTVWLAILYKVLFSDFKDFCSVHSHCNIYTYKHGPWSLLNQLFLHAREIHKNDWLFSISLMMIILQSLVQELVFMNQFSSPWKKLINISKIVAYLQHNFLQFDHWNLARLQSWEVNQSDHFANKFDSLNKRHEWIGQQNSAMIYSETVELVARDASVEQET